MKHFSIIDKNNNRVADNLTDDCKKCFAQCASSGHVVSCPLYGDQRRQGWIENSKSGTFLCCDDTKTTKLFREKLEALSYSFSDLIIAKEDIEEKTKKNEQKKVNRLVHNLSSINAHNIQEIYDLVPQETLSSNWKTQLEFIEREIKGNPSKAAMMFLRIAKNSIHMKSEFSIYRKLDREELASLEFRFFPVRSVLLNVLHTFFADFSNNGIYVNVNEYFGRVRIDYETIQVALYHLIENATKYVKHHSTITISFEDEKSNLIIHFSMISAFVDPNERSQIFNEGVSGAMAKKMKKQGDGIGLWRIKQIMKLNHGDFTAVFGEISDSTGGYDFANNTFSLLFKKY